MECGGYYARFLSSYSLLALSGFEYDMTVRHMGGSPAKSGRKDGHFKSFFSFDNGWGMFEWSEGKEAVISVLYGSLSLASLLIGRHKAKKTTLHHKKIAFRNRDNFIAFEPEISLKCGDLLHIHLT